MDLGSKKHRLLKSLGRNSEGKLYKGRSSLIISEPTDQSYH